MKHFHIDLVDHDTGTAQALEPQSLQHAADIIKPYITDAPQDVHIGAALLYDGEPLLVINKKPGGLNAEFRWFRRAIRQNNLVDAAVAAFYPWLQHWTKEDQARVDAATFNNTVER